MKTKKIFIICFLIILFCLNFSYATVIKIAILDWAKVSSNYLDFQDRVKELNQKKESVSNVVKKEEEEIAKLEKEAASLILESDITKSQKQIKQKKAELQNFNNEATSVLIKREDKLIESAKENINNAIKEVAAKEGISIVFSKSGVLYAAEESVDISDEVIKILNKDYKR